MDRKEMIEFLRSAIGKVDDQTAVKAVELYPYWVEGIEITQDMIDKGQNRYQFGGKLYKCIQPHTTQADWTPDVTPALWVLVSLEEWPEWVQPTGAHDAYAKGDKVTHNSKKWTSDVDANVWEPGVYGWTEFAE